MKRSERPTGLDYLGNPAITEPFGVDRPAARLLFDFAVMAACINPLLAEQAFLDFGAGSGWMTELLARMGRRVAAFDLHGNLESCLQHRVDADLRTRPELISWRQGDGHAMPFADRSFGHIFCYDTLHHMHDYRRVFAEFARVLEPGGRAIFSEPGARHSTMPATIAFLQEQKAHDPAWIERDVVLEEIDGIARAAGFTGLAVVPTLPPDSLISFTLSDWRAFRAGKRSLRRAFADRLSEVNYDFHVAFYCDLAR